MFAVPFYPLIKVDSLGTLRENWINKVRHTPYRTKNEDQFFRGEVYKECNYSLFTHVADWKENIKVLSHLLRQPCAIFNIGHHLFYNVGEQSLISRSTAHRVG